MSNSSVITVSQLNRYLRSVFDADMNLRTVFLSGEISGFVNHRSGHFYFTLKDDSSEIRAVMFRSSNQRLKFLPENGMKVLCKGRVTVYEPGGVYQITVDDMQPDGSGELNLAFEQLKEKLKAKGWFDSDAKKEIPVYPSKVGVITSPTGAAVKDIINVLSRRFPLAEMLFYPALVQGEGAAKDIADAIDYMNINSDADVLIVGRGGGSLEDLWAFNEEIVAEAVHNSKIPVISAVGHETDYTICDFVADLRAPTPSAAAELAVPDCISEAEKLRSAENKMSYALTSFLNSNKMELNVLCSEMEKHSPQSYISDMRMRCDKAVMKMEMAAENYIHAQRQTFISLVSGLESLSPLKILGSGYASVSSANKTVTSALQIKKDDKIEIRFSDGTVNCTVD